MISLILIAASILTSILRKANCVNLCLISGDGGLEGIIDQSGSPCRSYVMVCADIRDSVFPPRFVFGC